MRTDARLPLVACVAVIGLAAVPGNAGAFDLAAYLQHLQQVENLTADELLSTHEPFGPYADRVTQTSRTAQYRDALVEFCSLTTGELQLLDRHGFVVSERLAYPSYGAAFKAIWHADLPVFISSDAILHAVHRSYVDILAAVESDYLNELIGQALDALHASWPDLDSRYGSLPGMRASLDDVDVYLTVARSLLADQMLQSYGRNDVVVSELLQLIQAEVPASYPLFNEVPRIYDFSQLKPRGHYTQSVTLTRYFRAMMWLGRTEFRLTEPPGVPSTPDVSREIIAAVLLGELVDMDGGAQLESMDVLLRALVGAPDNVTLVELRHLTANTAITRADALLDPVTMTAFRSELATGSYTAQAINSQILLSSPLHPEDLDPPYAFLLMGQRFILDSYIAWNVVYDRIEWQDGHPFRGLPSPLDILFCLGNDDVLPFLHEEIEQYHYAANLSALRYLIDGYEPDDWHESLYTVWLQAIRTLSLSGRGSTVPEFMRTGAWQQEKMNTQLASWTELRHDNLLYAKQSYTGGAVCSFPHTYVEPIPELYQTLQTFADAAALAFAQVPPYVGEAGRIGPFFLNMAAIMSRLATIADKELSGEPFTPEELEFLAEVLYFGEHCVPFETGWYRDLYFSSSDEPTSEEDLLIADVHTQPTDAIGTPVGYVLHGATGAPEMGLFIAEPPGGTRTAFAGPVAAYFEHVTSNFQRLTDEEWSVLYEEGTPTRPDWTYVYLADAEGNVREGGRRLVAGPTETPEEPPTPRVRFDLAQNYPNPFNPSTLVRFHLEVPDRTNVSLRVYDVRGELVRVLLEDLLRTGTYHTRWDGKDSSGRDSSSGTYLLELKVGDGARTRKIVLLR